jgi:hypothetical protein
MPPPPPPTNSETSDHGPPGPGRKPSVKDTIMQLSKLLDLLGLRVQLGHKSRYGRKPHPTDPWGYTREYLAYYATESDPAAVIGLFEGAGVRGDLEAGRWLLQHDELIPDSEV